MRTPDRIDDLHALARLVLFWEILREVAFLRGPVAHARMSAVTNRQSQEFAVNLNRTMIDGELGASMESARDISVISTTFSIIWTGIRSLFGRYTRYYWWA